MRRAIDTFDCRGKPPQLTTNFARKRHEISLGLQGIFMVFASASGKIMKISPLTPLPLKYQYSKVAL